MYRRPSRPTLFPYTTLFRSHPDAPGRPVFRLPTLGDLHAIRRAIARVGAALVVVDPIMAYLPRDVDSGRSEEHTSELQSRLHLVCRLLLEKKKVKSGLIS